MSRRNHEGIADFCGVVSADAQVAELVASAIDGDAFAVHAAKRDVRDAALESLDSCRIHGCGVHGKEHEARTLLSEVPCTECRAWTRGDSLCDASEWALNAADVCEACALKLERDAEDAPSLARGPVRAGLSSFGIQVLGLTAKDIA